MDRPVLDYLINKQALQTVGRALPHDSCPSTVIPSNHHQRAPFSVYRQECNRFLVLFGSIETLQVHAVGGRMRKGRGKDGGGGE